MKRVNDDNGNIIINDNDNLYLKLATETRKRRVGTISNNNLIVKRKRDKHLHIKANAYGFNHYLIANATRFQSVILSDEQGTYRITNEDILKLGRFLYFKQSGLERQLFVPLEELEKRKIN